MFETRKVETIILTEENIRNKYVDLEFIPVDPTAVEVVPVGGILQDYGVDYNIISDGSKIKRLSWKNCKDLEDNLDKEDKLKISYNVFKNESLENNVYQKSSKQTNVYSLFNFNVNINSIIKGEIKLF